MTEATRDTLILKKFDSDPELARLEEMLVEFDAFAFLGLSTSEEIHSRILAWLLNPQENHSLGDLFLTTFLLTTTAITDERMRSMDWARSTVQREWRNVVDGKTGYLDILVVNKDSEFVCAIENKISTGEHDEQLTRYRQALEQQYGGFDRSHLFLTPQGIPPERPEEREFWAPVDYGTILRLVEETRKKGVDRQDRTVAAFLQQYATTLRRRIVPNTNLKQLATRLYLRHREAIDLINRHRGTYYLDDVRDICRQSIEAREGWHLVGERDGGQLIGFIDPCWQDFNSFHTGTAWLPQTDSLMIMDFDLRKVGQIRLIVTMSTADREDIRKALIHKMKEIHPRIFDDRGDQRGKYGKGTVRLYASEPILTEADFIDGNMTSWRDKVSEWVSNFARIDFPKMNEIIVGSLREIEAELGDQNTE